MAQNIYDNDSFFREYNKLPRSQEGLARAPEWPVLRAMVSPVQNISLLDLGCGYGWFCRWAREEGAKSVHGIDISEKMLGKAQLDWPADEAITYQKSDLDHVNLEVGRYDIVHSSLVFHYVIDIQALFQKVYDSLLPGGRFVFSIEHPLFTAPFKPRLQRDGDDEASWLLNSYHLEGERIRNWLGESVRKQHRTLASYLEALLNSGFRLTSLKEWKPNKEDMTEHPDWTVEIYIPIFLLIAAQKD